MKGNEEFWRTFINSLAIDDMPTLEEQKQEEMYAKDAAVMRLSLDIYLITPIDEEATKAYMINSGNKMEDLGVMTIKEALQEIQKRQKRKG